MFRPQECGSEVPHFPELSSLLDDSSLILLWHWFLDPRTARASPYEPHSCRMGAGAGMVVERGPSADQTNAGSTMIAVEYLARCHCGALTARYRTALEPSVWSVRACQCSFCRSHGALTTSDPCGLLIFACDDPKQVSHYRFGRRTAQFLVCRECGVYVGVEMRTDKGRFGVLNVLSLSPLLTDLPAEQEMDYSSETAEARRLRREMRWTPVSLESVG
jgi:hypothetical protein